MLVDLKCSSCGSNSVTMYDLGYNYQISCNNCHELEVIKK